MDKFKEYAYLCSCKHRFLPSEVVGTKVTNRSKQTLLSHPSCQTDGIFRPFIFYLVIPPVIYLFLINFPGIIRLKHIDVSLMRSTSQNNPFVFMYSFSPFRETCLYHSWT